MNNAWTRLFTPPRNGDGHKVSRRVADGAISLHDWSGNNPYTTDDGPLIVAPGTIVTVTVCRGDVVYIVPAHCERSDDAGKVWTTQATMDALVKALPSIRVEYDDHFRRAQDAIFHAQSAYSPAYC